MTRTIMIASSVLLAGTSLACLFVPEEAAAALHLSEGAAAVLPLVAAGHAGFAALNWVGRGAIYGGVYGKPIVLANFTIAAVTTLILVSLQFADASPVGVGVTAVFALYWLAFIRLLFWPPFGARR